MICEKHPSFRERSENVDLVVEISLQPWKVFKPDGVRGLLVLSCALLSMLFCTLYQLLIFIYQIATLAQRVD